MKKYSKEEVIYLPGWGDFVDFHLEFEGLDIWREDINYNDKIEAKCLVAHSLGCHFALLNWKENKNTKLILINPLLDKKPFVVWIFRWIAFSFFEGWKHYRTERLKK